MKRPYGSMRHLWMVTATSIAFAAGRRLNRPRLLRRCLLREGALPKPHRKTSKPGEESVSRTRELNDFFFFFFFTSPARLNGNVWSCCTVPRRAPVLYMDKRHGISRGLPWRRTRRPRARPVLAKAVCLQCDDPPFSLL